MKTVQKLTKEEFKKIIKEEVSKFLVKENWSDDELDLNSDEMKNAMKAASEDIEKEQGKGSFKKIGKDNFEKKIDGKSFTDALKIARMELPADEQEVKKWQEYLEQREDLDKKAEDIKKHLNKKYGINLNISMNENKK